MTDTVDYQAVVADLKARRATLDQLIATLEAVVLGQGDPGTIKFDVTAAVAPGAPGLPTAVHPDSFYGLSFIDAAKKFLRMARRAQHTAAIADAIGQGGLKRPDVNVLSSILVRAAKGREVTKVGKGMWGLSEWYPKTSKDAGDEPQRKARKGKKAVKATRRTAPPVVESVGGGKSDGVRPSDLILDVLREAGKPIEPKDILKQLKYRGRETLPGVLAICLHRHIKAGRVQKIPTTNTYRVVAEAA